MNHEIKKDHIQKLIQLFKVRIQCFEVKSQLKITVKQEIFYNVIKSIMLTTEHENEKT